MCFPVSNGAKLCKLRVFMGTEPMVFHLELDETAPEYYVWLDCLGHLGENIRMEATADVCRRLADCMIWSESPGGEDRLTGMASGTERIGDQNGGAFLDRQHIYMEPHRPLYHFTSPRGWINDPNGMVKLRGEYHLFYQLNMFGCQGIDKGWGHAKSRNLFDWELCPPALYASDRGYAISGSALFEQGSGRFVLAYTTRTDGRRELGQQQNIAFSDNGLLFEPYMGNPVLEDMASLDFRDPKVFWHEPTGAYVMVIAFGGKLRIYRSADLKSWMLASEVSDSDFNPEGYVYECPDLMPFEIEGEARTCWLLTFSLDTVRRVVCVPGHFDGWRFTPAGADGAGGKSKSAGADETASKINVGGMGAVGQVADWGWDFYAAVSFNPYGEMAGRKLWLGWMCYWDYAPLYPDHEGWRGMLTVPRQQRLVRHGDGSLRLHQQPAEEISELVTGMVDVGKIHVAPGEIFELPLGEACMVTMSGISQSKAEVPGGHPMTGQQPDVAELTVDLYSWCLRLCYGEHEWLTLSFVAEARQAPYILMERHCVIGKTLGTEFCRPVRMPMLETGGHGMDCTLLLDKGCVEIFLGQGEVCASALMPVRDHQVKLQMIPSGTGAGLYCEGMQVQTLRRGFWKL